MTPEEFRCLERSDIVVNTSSGTSYVVLEKIGGNQYVAVRSLIISNPGEWEFVRRGSTEA